MSSLQIGVYNSTGTTVYTSYSDFTTAKSSPSNSELQNSYICPTAISNGDIIFFQSYSTTVPKAPNIVGINLSSFQTLLTNLSPSVINNITTQVNDLNDSAKRILNDIGYVGAFSISNLAISGALGISSLALDISNSVDINKK